MLLTYFNRKEYLRHRAVSLRQHGFLVNITAVHHFESLKFWIPIKCVYSVYGSPSVYHISSKSVDILLIYGNLPILKTAAVRHLEFLNVRCWPDYDSVIWYKNLKPIWQYAAKIWPKNQFLIWRLSTHHFEFKNFKCKSQGDLTIVKMAAVAILNFIRYLRWFCDMVQNFGPF